MQITINDKKYDLNWGIGSIEIYCDNMDCDMNGLLSLASNDLLLKSKAITTLYLAGVQNACEIANKDFDVNYRQMQNWISEADQKVFENVFEDFMKSRFYGKTVSEGVFGIVPEVQEPTKKKSRSVK